MTRRIFVDAEWTVRPWSEGSELAWIGLADEAGRSWYAISSELNYDPYSDEITAPLFKIISRDEPRLTKVEMAAAIIDFCGNVDEFWAWVPSLKSFTKWSGLGDEAAAVYAKWQDYDLQMLRSLVQPWPDNWPDRIHDLNAARIKAGASVPPQAVNYKHPQVHTEWNRELFRRIQATRTG